jgi:2'-5' RNA ligase
VGGIAVTDAGSLRCFVAVHIDDATRAAVRALQGRLAGVMGGVKWVEPQNLHLTVKFLGNVDHKRLERLSAGLARAAAAHPPFTLVVRGAGAFPGPARPRVAWAGLSDGRAGLYALWQAVERELAREGFARDDRDFAPHLTLGRAREPAPAPGLVEVLREVADTTWGRFPVAAMSLMRSTLTPRGPIYEEIAPFPLTGA